MAKSKKHASWAVVAKALEQAEAERAAKRGAPPPSKPPLPTVSGAAQRERVMARIRAQRDAREAASAGSPDPADPDPSLRAALAARAKLGFSSR